MSLSRRVLLTAAALGFCAAAAPVFAQGAGEVNIYSSRHYKADAEVMKRFSDETGIKVNVIEGDINGLIQRLQREGAASPADLVITADAGNLWRLEQAGLAQPLAAPDLDAVTPPALRHPEGLWRAIATRARVIAYDKEKVDPKTVQRYEDLADPKWKGQVLTRSSSNVYTQSLLGSMVATQGAEKTEAWAKGIVANLARPPQGGDTDQINAIAAGQGTVALVNTYYYGRMLNGSPEERARAAKVGVVFPNQGDRGTHVNVSGVVLAKYAPNKANAVKLVHFLLSPAAQQMIAEGNYEYPVRADVPWAKTLQELGTFKGDAVNVTALGKNNPEAVKIADRAGWR